MATAPVMHRAAARFAGMVVVALVVGTLVTWWDSWELGLVVGWAAACLVYVAWVWGLIGPMGPDETRSHVAREDPARGVSELLILVATVASLGAVGMLLVEGHAASHARSGALAATAVAGVALSWLLIHTLFTLRYARLYFDGPPDIDFNTEVEQPRFTDFAYVAFSVGMTFQISDTNLGTSRLRALVLRHSLLSYVFGTVVVATTINLAVSLSG